MFKFFSIRSKILILLILVSFTSGLILLNLSVSSFKNDKIAYIFESNTNLATQFTEQLTREIQAVNQGLLLYINNYSKTGVLSESSADVIPESSILSGIQIFHLKKNNDLILASSIKKAESRLISENYPQLKAAVLRTDQSKKEFFYGDDQLHFLYRYTVGDNNYIVLCYYKSDTLYQFFNSASSYKLFLVNSTGEVFLKDSESNADFLTTNFSKLSENVEFINSSGTSKIRSDAKENWLLTTTQTPLSGLKLIMLVNENTALSALNQIVGKSVLIFIILSAAIVIIGIISANYLTNRLSLLSEHTRKITEGDFNTILEARGNDEVTELIRHFNKMTSELKVLMQATAHKSRMEAELKTAQAVQEILFPKNEYATDKIEIQGHYQSASECGGDWWHYHENNDLIHFWIADATGHGVSAALLTSAAKSSVTLIEDMGLSAVENMKMLNKSICSVSKDKLMMTCFHGIYYKKSQLLSYVNSSHEPPVLFKNSEASYTKGNLIFLNDNVDARLGYAADTEFTANEYQLNTGDRIYFYTDGVPDIVNSKGTPLGERGHLKNLIQILNEKHDLPSTMKTFSSSLEQFRGQSELHDDVTFYFMETK